jgi:hypothetical protein
VALAPGRVASSALCLASLPVSCMLCLACSMVSPAGGRRRGGGSRQAGREGGGPLQGGRGGGGGGGGAKKGQEGDWPVGEGVGEKQRKGSRLAHRH